ncbi:MAG: hypothetical protein KDE28_13500, partial [Anaerolineales bacterium]|nr:hypothetical protein [Anaerolineales bacterium]
MRDENSHSFLPAICHESYPLTGDWHNLHRSCLSKEAIQRRNQTQMAQSVRISPLFICAVSGLLYLLLQFNGIGQNVVADCVLKLRAVCSTLSISIEVHDTTEVLEDGVILGPPEPPMRAIHLSCATPATSS